MQRPRSKAEITIPVMGRVVGFIPTRIALRMTVGAMLKAVMTASAIVQPSLASR